MNSLPAGEYLDSRVLRSRNAPPHAAACRPTPPSGTPVRCGRIFPLGVPS